MNKEKLSSHIKLCLKNLKSYRVKCCANCPFKEEILSVYPDMKDLFESKIIEVNKNEKQKKSDRVEKREENR
jgi:hypothetical protein